MGRVFFMTCNRCKKTKIKHCILCKKYGRDIKMETLGIKTQEFCTNPQKAYIFNKFQDEAKDLVLSIDGDRLFGRIYVEGVTYE